jgi:hypothetical protein
VTGIVGAAFGALLGGGAGLLVSRHLHRFTGGTCPILCNPRVAVPYFAVLGLLIGSGW